MKQTTITFMTLTILDSKACPKATMEITMIEMAKNRYSPQLIRTWSHYLRTVANKLNEPNNELANRFYNVHYAIGPENMTEFDIFALDNEYLELVAEQDKKTPEEVMRGMIEDIKVVIDVGDSLGQEFMSRSVWGSDLKDYLSELLAHLTQKSQ